MSRPSKLTEKVLAQLEDFIGVGCTVEVACAQVGIAPRTFYNWKSESARLCALGDEHGRALLNGEDVLLLQFLQAITRAQARAHAVATSAVFSGLIEHRTVSLEPYTYTETRLRKSKDGEEIPYVYQETRLRQVEHITPPDWRAGIEFLKRRDAAAWNPPTKLEVTWEDKAVAAIQAGEVDFWTLAEEFDDYDLAADLFARAGKITPPRTRETAERKR